PIRGASDVNRRRPEWSLNQIPVSVSSRRQICQRVDRCTAAPNLKVQAWRGGIGLTQGRDPRALGDLIACFHEQRLVMGVGSDEAVRMTEQNQITEATHTVAGIHDFAIGGRKYRVALLPFNINSLGIGIEALNDL